MKPLSLEDVRRAVRGRWLSQASAASVDRVSTDTRTAREGDLFFALLGRQFDAHAFLPRAAEAGCRAAVVRRDAGVGPDKVGLFRAGVIAVDDTTAALCELASYHRGLAGAAVVGVTGSNGKTTVKRMIHHILSARLSGSCSPKSFNNEVGVPLTLLGVAGGDDYVVCEIGSSAPGEIARLAALVRPDVAVITSVSETHLEKLGSVERVAAEKASLLDCLVSDGLAVVWADSQELDKAVRHYNRRLIRFGQSDQADLRLTGYEQRGPGGRFELNGRLWVNLSVPGVHNALNAMAAIAVAQRFGWKQEEAAEALAEFQGDSMRLAWIEAGDITLINDAYNANPASLVAAADVLAGAPGRRKVIIVGDMRELGPQAPAIHLRTGRELASRKVDFLIGVGELGRYIAMGAAETLTQTACFDSVQQACREVIALLRPGDVVLVKGSRAMAMEQMIEPIRSAFAPRRAGRRGREGT